MKTPTLMQRFTASMIRARWIVMAILLMVTVAFGVMIPKLHADFTPSDLFASFGDAEEVAADFRENFGNTDNIVLVLVEADDVTTPETLGYVYTLTEKAKNIPGVQSVQSIASLPKPSAALMRHMQGSVKQAAEKSENRTEHEGKDDQVDREDSALFTDTIFDLYDALFAAAQLSTGKTSDSKDDKNSQNSEDNYRFAPLISSVPVSPETSALVQQMSGMSQLVGGRMLARDNTVTSVVAFLDNSITQNKDLENVVVHFEDMLAKNPPPAEVKASIGGLPYIRTTVVRNMSADQAVLLPLAIVVSLFILFFAFRWLPALLLPIAGVGMSAVILVGGMAIFGISMDILNNIIPTLVVLIGISSTIHIINRYRDNVALGDDRNKAASNAMATMVTACFLTSATTAIGFASLGVSKTEILQRFGLTAGAGVMIAYVVVILFVPAALTLFPRPEVNKLSDQQGSFEDRIESLTRWVLHHRLIVLITALLSIVIALVLGFRTQVDSAVLDQVNPKDEVYRTTRLLEEKLTGFRPLEVYIRTEHDWQTLDPDTLKELHTLMDYAREQDGVITTLGYFDLLVEAQRMLGQESPDDEPIDREQLVGLVGLMQAREQNPLAAWLKDSGRTARAQIMVQDMGAHKTNLLLDDLERKIAELNAKNPDVSIRLTGDAYVGSRGLDAVITDLISSLATAIIIIFLLLTLLFRSLRLGVVSIPPALMPLAFTLCWMWVRGIPLNTATAIIFSIAVGMTVDGCIHFMTRFREEYDDDTLLDEAIVRAARSTGKAIVFTCVALVVGFGVMLVSQFVPIRRFGELVAFTITVMMLATMLVLPALLRLAYSRKEKRRIETRATA